MKISLVTSPLLVFGEPKREMLALLGLALLYGDVMAVRGVEVPRREPVPDERLPFCHVTPETVGGVRSMPTEPPPTATSIPEPLDDSHSVRVSAMDVWTLPFAP